MHEYRRRASKCAEQLDADEIADDDEDDDVCSSGSDDEQLQTTDELQVPVPCELDHLRLPFPDFQPVVFRFLHQTTRPRDWCLRIVTWKYLFLTSASLSSACHLPVICL